MTFRKLEDTYYNLIQLQKRFQGFNLPITNKNKVDINRKFKCLVLDLELIMNKLK